jgi:ferritin
VKLAALKAPPTEWKSPRHVFEEALKHEEYITGRINDLAALADQENDRSTQNLLQWFIAEQVEEEASVQDVLDKFDILADHPGGMYLLDRDLMTRGSPSPVEE